MGSKSSRLTLFSDVPYRNREKAVGLGSDVLTTLDSVQTLKSVGRQQYSRVLRMSYKIGMSARTLRTMMLCVVLASSLLLLYMPQAFAQGYYSYDTKTGMWIWISTTWKPSTRTTLITISVKGLPPEFSTMISIDGKQVGTIPGGGSKAFEVDKKSSHTFQVDAQIKGSCSSYEGKSVCTRYKCPNSVWTVDVIQSQTCEMVPVCYQVWVCDCCACWWEHYCQYEQQCHSTAELAEKGHTFENYAEHELIIADVHGQNIDNWYKEDSESSFSAKEFVVTRDESDVKERDVFLDWMVNGVPMESRTLTLKMDRPYYVRAEYRVETEYRVRISSEFGTPGMDNPKGWYMKGQEATVSVEREMPLEGWMGTLGGKRVFDGWTSDTGLESRMPTFTFEVDEPKRLQAEWRTDDSQPMTIIAALVIIVIAVLAVLLLYKTGHLFRGAEKRAEQTELEKAKSEIESLKKELEELKKVSAKRKPAHEEQHT